MAIIMTSPVSSALLKLSTMKLAWPHSRSAWVSDDTGASCPSAPAATTSPPPRCVRRDARSSAALMLGGSGGWSLVMRTPATSTAHQAGTCHPNSRSSWPGPFTA